jgi:hypothetical protein
LKLVEHYYFVAVDSRWRVVRAVVDGPGDVPPSEALLLVYFYFSPFP